MADSKLASEIGANVARLLYAELDEIGEAVSLELGQVSFSVTCIFFKDKDGNIQAKLEPRKRIPQMPVTLKLLQYGKQLSLFE